ncbi:hypothetical protein [Rhizobium sp. LjRoot254]|uniref:hypothetical protein n=1 Tax=Rhizobium sp. LjRoot254 TaxID=3342297 RepID=UPI003ED12FF1
MLKLIISGVWVAIVTLGSVYFSIQMSKAPDPAEEEARKRAVQELVKGEVVTFPVIAQGRVEGYFLTRTSFITDKTKLADITLPIPELLTDEMYTELVGDKVIRVSDNRNFDLKVFKARVKEALNKKLGSEVVLDVIVEQIDYLTKEEILSSMSKPGSTIKSGERMVSEKAPDDVTPAKSDGGNAH